MSSTHHTIVERERVKYQAKGWLAFTEVPYQGVVFDLVAFHPKTKEIEIVEVDISSGTSKEKMKLAKTIGKIKIFRPYSTLLKTKIKPKKLQSVLNTLSHPIRIAIMELLYDQECRHTNILSNLGLHFKDHAGKFAYHLNQLLREEIIIKNHQGKYQISKRGRILVDFFRKLDNSVENLR